jgi:hypothetical protein
VDSLRSNVLITLQFGRIFSLKVELILSTSEMLFNSLNTATFPLPLSIEYESTFKTPLKISENLIDIFI